MKKLNLNSIRIDGGTQSRVEINNEAVSDYAEAVKVGIEFPPVVVFHDGADHWLADGFHRYHAHKQAGKASIGADILQGTIRDAILYSLAANGTHGLRRSNADKRKAVQTLLTDAEWSEWSDRKIAETCGVSVPFVGAIRRPEVAEKQQAARAKSASPQIPSNPEGCNPITPSAKKEELKSSKRSVDNRPADIPAATSSDELAEAHHAITDLAQENEQLRDRLAVEAMDASEEEKTLASETIAELRERVRVLEIELAAVKASRDTYMRESAEKTNQITYWRKQAEKAERASA